MSLISALGTAERGSRELSDLVLIALGWKIKRGRSHWMNPNSESQYRVEGPALTESLDDIVAECERRAPEWTVIHAYWNKERAIFCLSALGTQPLKYAEGKATTPALALCAALIRALGKDV